MRLPAPERSYAVLIGTARYHSPELIDLPAVTNNLDELASVLTDPTLGGLPAERCVVLHDPVDVRTVYRTLRRYAADTEDTLLVYFAGHGRISPRNELYLSLTDTDPDELPVTALSVRGRTSADANNDWVTLWKAASSPLPFLYVCLLPGTAPPQLGALPPRPRFQRSTGRVLLCPVADLKITQPSLYSALARFAGPRWVPLSRPSTGP